MQPYQPNKLPPSLDYNMLLPLVGRANAVLGRYDGLLRSIPNPQIMLSQLTLQEAVLSSRIEGTQATADEVLEQEAGMVKEGEKGRDVQEISNYREALLAAQNHGRPITLSLVCALHGMLMDSVRGQDKTPGAFRKDQNWIGRYGCTMEQATFVPPSPLQLMDHLQAWEHYLGMDDADLLVQTAIMHAQFELLHPFKDGNGRIGRLLIPLFLHQKGALSQPMFYLSEYLESHRDAYYSHLQAISINGSWDEWVAFFLGAIIQQAQRNSNRAEAIQSLYEQMKEAFHQATRSQYSVYLLDAIFRQPIFRAADLARALQSEHGMHRVTTPVLLRQLREAGILTELRPGRGGRSTLYGFSALMDITQGGG